MIGPNFFAILKPIHEITPYPLKGASNVEEADTLAEHYLRVLLQTEGGACSELPSSAHFRSDSPVT